MKRDEAGYAAAVPDHQRTIRPLDTDVLDAVSAAVSGGDAIASVLSRFGAGAVLYAADHAFDTLGRIGGSDGPEEVRLEGELRAAVLSGSAHAGDTGRWYPLSDRGQVIFIVKVPIETDVSPERRPDRISGLVLARHLRRFEELDRRRRRADMSVAAELQWELLPVRADSMGEYDVASVLEPAYEVAGDFFEYAEADGSVWAYSFDGMGHGLEATMTALLALTAVRNGRRQGASLTEQFTLANDVLFEQYGGDRFVTAAGCRFDPAGQFEVVNAGHEPIRSVIDGRVQPLLLVAELPLGVTATPEYTAQRGPELDVGDGVAMFSDGPAAVRSPEGARFGAERLDASLEAAWSELPMETVHDMMDAILEYVDDQELGDDVTAVVVRRSDRGEGNDAPS